MKLIIILEIILGLLFVNCKEKSNLKKDNSDFLSSGKKIIMNTGKELIGNLNGAIGTKGTKGAIEFCNLKAPEITKKKSDDFKVNLNRVSDKPRNPNNKANKIEIDIINDFKKLLNEKKEIKPVVKIIDNLKSAYFPIVTNEMCMQCHGDIEKEITEEVSLKLKELYPTDEATGYKINQLRGLWVLGEKE